MRAAGSSRTLLKVYETGDHAVLTRLPTVQMLAARRI